MKRKNESDETGQGQRRPPAGNRGLLVAGLGAALAAVLSLGLLSAVSGSTPAGSEQDTGAAQAPVAAAEARPAAAKADHQVDIMGNKFGDGKQLVVEVGQTVRWTNHDSVPHTVTTTKAPVKFDSGTLEQGDSWSYTFTKAGTYEYYCAVHPDMVASVKVVEGSGGGGGGSTPAPTPTPTPTPTAPPTTGPTSAPPSSPAPTPTPTGGTGGGGSGGDEQCTSVQNVLLPILQHLYVAHLERSPGEQVQDALALDSYIKMHTVWVESILKPAVEGGGTVLDDTLSVLLNHVNKAHLEESLGQQVTDLLNPDSYVKMHTVWAGQMLTPTTDFLTNNC
ncbi:cupredoxin family copper-binding protein [Streptomyces sp. HP-A2021]|uniref:cupredoxin domain-containing protein n=1 Tax=Streptomyces sp. HP-A2021 TaxID=2927875 RepID=UPI001FAEEE1B|nr:cupredoxin family copper-binding protein [Streptomyces sp. HP-A2021]UOB12437.1 cupredoxin family copper-binding protein [Streptomyces sp. HP-A2021]